MKNRTEFLVLVLIPLLSGCGQPEGFIRIKGSDTEVNLAVALGEGYHADHRKVDLAISGGGSGLGIASLMNGLTDIANSSRPLSPEEVQLLQEKKVEVLPFILAYDALAIIVHEDLPLDSLSVEQLGTIFSGAVADWSAVCTEDLPITVYGRQNNSGTHGYLQEKLGVRFGQRARELNGNAQIIEAVKADKGGIGYVGVGYIVQHGVLVTPGVRILGVHVGASRAWSPADAVAVVNGDYFFKRPLYQFVRAASLDRVRALLDFEGSAEGRSIIERNGYYTAKAPRP